MALLDIEGLGIGFPGRRVVEDVSLRIEAGEIVAVIGESGSGKTLTALSVLGLLPDKARVTGGRITFDGLSLLDLKAGQRRDLLGNRLAFIPQDAMRALNPVLTVGDQVGEPLVLHRGSTWASARRAAVELLGAVRLGQPARRAGEYPHQFSGGMQQRAMIAMGLALEPQLLIADEPTTALDVTVQAQVIQLLRDIRRKHGTSILFISHDLGLVADFCDRVYVMYAGRVIEEGRVDRIFESPRHPYTAALLAATPSVTEKMTRLGAIPGHIPQIVEINSGCVFAPRCPRAQPPCAETPPYTDFPGDQRVRCWFPLEPA